MNEITRSNETAIATNCVNAETLNSFISYLDTSKKTIETYTRALKQFYKYLSFNGITEPKREDIIRFRDDLKATGHKPTTIQNYITAVKIFFNWTEQTGQYPNIANHLKGAKVDREHKKDYLTANQIKAILNNIDTSTVTGKRDFAIIALMTTGGLRTIEVSRANIEDIRTVGNSTVLYIQGKGHEEKTDYIKISEQVEQVIREYLKARGTASENEPLFTSTSNNSKGNRLSTRTISGIAKDHFRKAGYDSDRLTAHSLRHTAVTLALLAGENLAEVQQFARHTNISTTMIYNHSIEKAKNSCNESIAKAIF